MNNLLINLPNFLNNVIIEYNFIVKLQEWLKDFFFVHLVGLQLLLLMEVYIGVDLLESLMHFLELFFI